MFMMGYLLFRFCLDFYKAGLAVFFFGMGSIQIACLLGLLYYYRYLINPRSLLQEFDNDINKSGRYRVPTRS